MTLNEWLFRPCFIGKASVFLKKVAAFSSWLVLAVTMGGFAVKAQTTATLTVQANQPGAFFRVILSNPVNGQLNTVTNGFFAVASLPGGALQLGVAPYLDENLVYWTATNAALLEATNLAGPWTTNNTQAPPILVPESSTLDFFHLAQ